MRRTAFYSVLMIARCVAQDSVANEYQVKAAFLFNFAKFVEWPSSSFRTPDAPLEICILGNDPFDLRMENSIAARTVNGRRIAISHYSNASVAPSCQILFVASSEKRQVKNILKQLSGSTVLTVGDISGFADDGRIIDFVLEGDRVRFEVNNSAAARAHLKLSARLLTVAKSIVGHAPGDTN